MSKYTPHHILYYIDGYEKSMQDYGRSPLTTRNVKDSLKLFISSLGAKKIDALNDNIKVEVWLLRQKEERNWSPSTRNSYRKNLIAFVNYLLRLNVVEENRLRLIPKVKESIKRSYYLDDDNVEKILSSIDVIYDKQFYRIRNKLVIRLFALTGMRPSELCDLKLEDVDFQKGEISIATKKNGVNRSYPLPSSIFDLLSHYMVERNKILAYAKPCEYLFVSVKGVRLGLSGIRRLFNSIVKETGIDVIPYDLRRYVASRLERKGLELAKISKYLGHNSLSTTRRYLEDSAYQTAEGVGLMSKLFR